MRSSESTTDHRVALITGAAGGIGQATVAAFVDSGWRVVAVDRVENGDLPAVVAFHRVDLTDIESVAGLFERLRDEPGRLDALVNNAGVQISKPILETTVEDWDHVMETNLRSTFLMGKHSLNLLGASRGSVVNVSSVHALATSLNIAAYAASKEGILALTRAMAPEFGARGVRVNTILPGAVDTPMLRAGLVRIEGRSLEAKLRVLSAKTALGRVGEPYEIAQGILFLADSDRSSFITGQALVIDGGATARLRTE